LAEHSTLSMNRLSLLLLSASVLGCSSASQDELIANIGACQRLLTGSQAPSSPIAIAQCLGEHYGWKGNAIEWAGAYIQLENRRAALALLELQRANSLSAMDADLQTLRPRVAPFRQRAEFYAHLDRCHRTSPDRLTPDAQRKCLDLILGPRPAALLPSEAQLIAKMEELQTAVEAITKVLADSIRILQRLVAADSSYLASLSW
jgi:hypothetical protein